MIKVKDILDEIKLRGDELRELEEGIESSFIKWLSHTIRCDNKSVIGISTSLNKIILHIEEDEFMTTQDTTELYNKFISLLKDPRFINHSIKVKENNIEKELFKITYRHGLYDGFKFSSSNEVDNPSQRFQYLHLTPPINPIQININIV